MNGAENARKEKRSPLESGARVTIDGRTYEIVDVMAFGGSCIAYRAERVLSEYEKSIGVGRSLAVIKEFYPNELEDSVERVGDKLVVSADAEDDFRALKGEFENGTARQVAFYDDDANHALPPATVGDANGTVYSAVVLTKGATLDKSREGLSLYEISEVMISVCNALKKLHNRGELYLDLKPENIFLFNKESSESRRIALFDFDTVINAAETLNNAFVPYSEGFSPPEQEFGHLDELSTASDIFSVGSVFYWLLSGEPVGNVVISAVEDGKLDFIDGFEVCKNSIKAKKTAKCLMGKTLRRVPADREQHIEILLGA